MWMDTPLTELQGKTFAIRGMGNIGREVARIAQAFGMRVVAVSRQSQMPEGVEKIAWDDALREADDRVVGDLVVSIFENTGLFPELATFIPLFCMIGLLTTFAAASDLFLVSFALVLNTDVQYAVLPLALTLGVTKLLMLGLNKVMYKFKFYDTEEENEEIL